MTAMFVPMPGPEGCAVCAFYRQTDNVLSLGDCRRHAPVARRAGRADDACWPQVEPSTWCGDFERRIVLAPDQVLRPSFSGENADQDHDDEKDVDDQDQEAVETVS